MHEHYSGNPAEPFAYKPCTAPTEAEYIAQLEAKVAELEKEDIAQLKTQLHQTEIERNMASDCVKADGEQISQLTRERDELRSSNQLWSSLMKDAKKKIARLRDERRLLAEVTLRQDDVITEQRDELDRLREENEALTKQCTDLLGDAVKHAETEIELDRMRKALEPFANCVFYDNGDMTADQSRLNNGHWLRAYRTLNPQPAQEEA